MELKEIVDTIHDAVDCRDVASVMLGLETKPKNHNQSMILCLNHPDEHFGSCFVRKEFVHCFACGWHADAIALVRKAKDCSFGEATRALNDYYGLGLDLSRSDSKPEKVLRLSAADLALIGITDRTGIKDLYNADRKQFWVYMEACVTFTDQQYTLAETSNKEVSRLLDRSADLCAAFIKKIRAMKAQNTPDTKLVVVD